MSGSRTPELNATLKVAEQIMQVRVEIETWGRVQCKILDAETAHTQSAVWQDDGAELFSVICYALAQRDYRPVVRMKSIVDGDFFVLLFVGMM